MLKPMSLVFGWAAALVAVAGAAQAASISFSTDFSGTALDSHLTAPFGSGVTVNNGVAITAAGDIWGTSFNSPTVRYSVDPADTQDFTIETVLTGRDASGPVGTGIVLAFTDRTGLYGPWSNGVVTDVRYEDNVSYNNGGWGAITHNIADSDVNGSSLSFAERVTRQDNIYSFYFKETSSSAWTLLGTADLGSTGPSWVGLFDKIWYAGDGVHSTSTYSSFSFTVPEPGTLALLAGCVGLCQRRRR